MPNVDFPAGNEYHDLSVISGLPQGASYAITNNTSALLYIHQSETQPTGLVGYPLEVRGTAVVPGDTALKTWCKGVRYGDIYVQPVDSSILPLTSSGTISGASPSRGIVTDRQGRSVKISQKGEMLTGSKMDVVDINFQYNIRPAKVKKEESGTGFISHPGAGGSYAMLSPGTGVGKAALYSRFPIIYRAGHESYAEISWIFRQPEDSPDYYEFCGFFDDTDRWCVGYKGLDFGVLFMEAGNETFVKIGADSQYGKTIDPLDGTGPSQYTIDPLSINVFRLSFAWHGGLPLTLEVQVGQQWYPVFVLDFSNHINETHLENPNLPVGGFIERKSGTGSDSSGRTGSWGAGTISSAPSVNTDDWVSHTKLDHVLQGGVRNNIITLTNPATWQGKANHVVYEVGELSIRNDGNKTVAVFGTKGATLTEATTPVFIDEPNYSLLFSEGGTVTGGKRGPATILGPDSNDRLNEAGKGVYVFPGESLTIEADPGGAITGEFSCTVRMIHKG